ncbi:Ubiquitin-conjugating enzyme E2Q-like protein 1 [Psilocybe cubensis]|uniref:Ubiquitin-conjugating enzyme E2Q-like protein 1 n=2 Tax=Psilocybe cubensis TaxID=181762 RepID=A0ACB8GI55_PSICU|nr:Ubiquitin-conjugating enzyme E2Q-like protein 1 [Psilocybe cubensis]KAH9475092.1 Ubiquitin-conjugating enzyme E2Q-like protein 1 [Psilocybe cubensis]
MPRVEATTSTRQAASFDYSDSESFNQAKPASKRQKIISDPFDLAQDTDKKMIDESTDVAASSAYDPLKNKHLKGRRRFNADLADISEACSAGLVLSGLRVKKIGPGEDDGSFELDIETLSSEHVLSLTLLVSDTSEYPEHTLYGHTTDPAVPPKLAEVVENIADESAKSIGEAVVGVLASVGRAIADEDDGDDDEAHSGDDYDYEDYDEIGAAPVESENFIDIVATGYRPGFIRLGGNDFVVSVSLPVITLAEAIPPRALMAWDRRLLSTSQHLTLLISGFHGLYPVLENDATYTVPAQRLGASLSFKVGLSERYKPGTAQAQEVVRKHGLIIQDAEDELRIQAELAAQKARVFDFDAEFEDDELMQEVVEEEEEPIDPGRFDSFSLSSSLESLMDQSFLKLIQLRRNFGLGWAGAELLISLVEKSQRKEEDVFAMYTNEIRQADHEERGLARTTKLPHDPLSDLNPDDPFNLPLTAFCYLVRRLSLCPKYCIVCHNKLTFDYEALKPYVCDSKLCSYQYYSLNRGPSLEYEILHNSQTVDLLVSLAYVSASEGVMDEPLPIGLGLRVPLPSSAGAVQAHPNYVGWNTQPAPTVVPETPKTLSPGPDGLCDFDDLTHSQMRLCIAKLINTLPSIDDMKKHLERKVKAGKSKPKLREIDPNVIPAAWSILRWVVASCTAHIEPIESGEELIKNLDPSWRQFRLTVGAPEAEAKFKEALQQAATEDPNVRTYPVIYIIRHGLWYRTVAHGRAYGDGVYLAKEANTSMSSYAVAARTSWQKSMSGPTNCVAVTEVVNQPTKFVSSNPHYVVKDTHWIMCRYLLVRGTGDFEAPKGNDAKGTKTSQVVPFVRHDPAHRTTVSGKVIEIPDPSYKVISLLEARKTDYMHEDPDAEDMAIFELDPNKPKKSSEHNHYDFDDDDDYTVPVASSSKSKVPQQRQVDDWKHDAEYVTSTLENLLLPPFESSPSASMAIQRELKSMLKEQETAPSLKDLGWYMPPELIGDNLYQWIVEMHSLDPTLPIAKDMKQNNINSIIFEIRFPPTFPNSPPFFRIITPRFLPFIQGGGGHVTGGGSICMDLLTSDGWLPSYSISAVLMQIRLALSNLEPRPARLASDWKRPYGIQESLVGYKRAAATHNWTLPPGLDRLVR